MAPTRAPTTGLNVRVRTVQTAISSKLVGKNTKTAARNICWMLRGPAGRGGQEGKKGSLSHSAECCVTLRAEAERRAHAQAVRA